MNSKIALAVALLVVSLVHCSDAAPIVSRNDKDVIVDVS